MTSVLNVDSIAAKDGTSPVELTKQSAAKAWIFYQQSSTAIKGSFNISSVTDSATTGIGTVNFTNAMSDAFYSVAGMSGNVTVFETSATSGGVSSSARSGGSSSAFIFSCVNESGTKVDNADVSLTVDGDLA